MDPNEYISKLRSGPIERESPFPIEEFQTRIAKVREEMGKEGLDGLIVCMPGNLNYLTGYYTFGIDNFTCVVLPLEGEVSAFTQSSEIPSVVLATWVEDVTGFTWPWTDKIGSMLSNNLKGKGLENKRIGIELSRGGAVPRIYNDLQKALPNATVVDGSGLVERIKVTKSPMELELMRTAGKMTSTAINAALKAVKAGITDNDVASVGYKTLIEEGSEFTSLHPIVTTGHRSSWHHTSFKRNPLEVGDIVFLEYGASYHRYHAPMMRTAVIGPPSDDIRRIADASRNTVNLVIENARGGRTSHDVARDALKGFAGLEDEAWFMRIIGYSIGIGFPPNWADCQMFIAEGVDKPLLPGMTFHLPIMYRVPRKFGVGLSETIAITEDGCEVLTEPDRDIFIAPG
jgi:Xaa-Pro aminopeptidase